MLRKHIYVYNVHLFKFIHTLFCRELPGLERCQEVAHGYELERQLEHVAPRLFCSSVFYMFTCIWEEMIFYP